MGLSFVLCFVGVKMMIYEEAILAARKASPLAKSVFHGENLRTVNRREWRSDEAIFFAAYFRSRYILAASRMEVAMAG